MTFIIGPAIAAVQTDYHITHRDALFVKDIATRMDTISAIRVLRLITGCGLREAKEFIDGGCGINETYRGYELKKRKANNFNSNSLSDVVINYVIDVIKVGDGIVYTATNDIVAKKWIDKQYNDPKIIRA